MLSSVERIEGDLEASGQLATASFAVYPVQGSGLAAWSGMQKPSDYSVASRLPAGSWLMVAAGRIDSGPLQGFAKEMADAQGKPEMAEWIGVFGQEVAFALLAKEDKTVRMAGLVAVTDAKKLGDLIAGYIKKMAAQPTPMDSMEVTAKAKRLPHGRRGAARHHHQAVGADVARGEEGVREGLRQGRHQELLRPGRQLDGLLARQGQAAPRRWRPSW